MANTGVISFTNATPGEFPAVLPKVYVNGRARIDYYCDSIEVNSGILPSKAMLRWLPQATYIPAEVQAPITLDSFYYADTLETVRELHGSRVVVQANGETLFAGHMLQRMDAGAADEVLWTAYDDREIMSKIPVRGAVVRDDYGTAAKFLPRYEPHVNPSGTWNCVGWTCNISGHPLSGLTIPVFASRGHIKVSYESPDATFSPTLVDGEITAWTPRRFLTYLYFVAHLQRGDIDGVGADSKTWRSLIPSRGASLFEWSFDSIKNMIGIDPASTGLDPLDRKMADMGFQGLALLQAMADTLVNAGTHDMSFTPYGSFDADGEGDDQVGIFNGDATTRIDFFPIGKTGAMADKTTFSSIPLMRQGTPDSLPNCNTAYDFQLLEDSTNTRMACMVEGDTIRTETRVTVDAGLVKAWSAGEESAFKLIIWGDESAGVADIKYAKYPQGLNLDNEDIPAFGSWVDADGGSGRELAYAYSPEAVRLARRLFPRVYRAFRIDSSDAEVTAALAGYASAYSDTAEFPQGNINRPVLPNQLQYQLADLSAGGGVENKLAAQLPIRVSVENGDATNGYYWQDAGWTNATMIGEGVFLLDMAEQYDNTPQCIYSGHLYSTGSRAPLTTLDCELKNVRMNIAVPMDHRAYGYAETAAASVTDGHSDLFYVNANYDTATGGLPMQYIDSGGTYREEHQVASYPTDDASVKNRLLPPGSEAENAEYAAQRRLYQTQRIDRLSSWRMVGIRPEWRVGMWIDQVDQIGVSAAGVYQVGIPYRINGPIRSLVYDFVGRQDTTIGGIIGETV